MRRPQRGYQVTLGHSRVTRGAAKMNAALTPAERDERLQRIAPRSGPGRAPGALTLMTAQ